MNEDALRALVREAIERHIGPGAQSAASRPPVGRAHPSHGRFQLASGDEDGGPCLIEPSVRCNHCGYCQSYGH